MLNTYSKHSQCTFLYLKWHLNTIIRRYGNDLLRTFPSDHPNYKFKLLKCKCYVESTIKRELSGVIELYFQAFQMYTNDTYLKFVTHT